MDSHEIASKVKAFFNEHNRNPTRAELVNAGVTDWAIRHNGNMKGVLALAGLSDVPPPLPIQATPPKILILDIETSPMLLWGYGMYDQNFSVDQIYEDWYLLSWAAKWLGTPPEQVMYADIKETPKDDSGIASQIWQLIDEADIIVGQNSVRFDEKKLNARFGLLDMPLPASYRSIDTMQIVRNKMALSSTKLVYTSDRFCKWYKKYDHGKYPGFSLFKECMKMENGKYVNEEAWLELQHYNKYDVLATEEYFLKIWRYQNKININAFYEDFTNRCICGSVTFKEHGYVYTNSAKYQRLICTRCGSEYKDKSNNLLSKVKRASLRELSL